MATDAVAAETQRLLDEMHTARKPVLGNREPDPLAKARHDRAQDAVFEHRRMLRRVGQYFGDRPYPTPEMLADGYNPDRATGVRTADNETSPPTILKETS